MILNALRLNLPVFANLIASATLLSAFPTPLSFEQKKQTVIAAPGAARVTFTYTFKNISDQVVEISRVDSACTCMKAGIKNGKMVYKPGESGELLADVEVGNLNGTINKQALVWLKGDVSKNPPIVLSAEVTIPDLIQIEPKSLIWNKGEAPNAKSFKVTLAHDQPTAITKVVKSNDDFSHELKILREGREYEIVVTPGDTNSTGFATFKVILDDNASRPQSAQAFAIVKQ